MCRDGQGMPAAAQEAVGRVLHDIADALARAEGVPVEDVRVGPVDLGGEPRA